MNACSPSLEDVSNQEVKEKKAPRHIAIIMDGNRRWARKRNLPIELGHWKGIDALLEVVLSAIEMGVEVLTVYAFSTENWNRTKSEVESLMTIFKAYLNRERARMVREGIQLKTIGDLSRFPHDVKDVLDRTKLATSLGDKIQLVLALNYGGRDDVKRAIWKILDDVKEGKIQKEECTEELISSYLDTAPFGDPDLLIRTSGEKRVSNFLLWQISYSEVYLTDVLWPDFTKSDLKMAIEEYQKRSRRLGG